MKALKMMMVVAALSVLLAATPGWTQTPAPAQQPPAPPPAAQAPRPFPEGARVAYIDVQIIASESAEGKAATAKLDDLRKKRAGELQEKNKQVQALQTKLQQGGTVMSDAARMQLEREIEKQQRELQFAQQDAQNDINEMTQQLQFEFQERLQPVIEAIREERGLHIIFSVRDSGIISADTGLDLSAEVIKRFDAMAKTGKP